MMTHIYDAAIEEKVKISKIMLDNRVGSCYQPTLVKVDRNK